MKIRSPILSFAVTIAVIAAVVLSTACPPKKDALRSAIEASYRLPAATNDVIAKTENALAAGTIDAAAARRIGSILEPIARAEVVFVGMVKAAAAVSARADVLAGITNKTPDQAAELVSLQTELKAKTLDLKSFFDIQILGPFLDVLTAVKVLDPDAGRLIILAVSTVKLILASIGKNLGSAKVKELTRARNAGNGVARETPDLALRMLRQQWQT